MKEVYSITITPLNIIEKDEYKVLMISSRNKYERVDSSSLKNFEINDYLFMGRMVGKGFIQLNYVKMNKKEIKKFFPKQKPPKDYLADIRYDKFSNS